MVSRVFVRSSSIRFPFYSMQLANTIEKYHHAPSNIQPFKCRPCHLAIGFELVMEHQSQNVFETLVIAYKNRTHRAYVMCGVLRCQLFSNDSAGRRKMEISRMNYYHHRRCRGVQIRQFTNWFLRSQHHRTIHIVVCNRYWIMFLRRGQSRKQYRWFISLTSVSKRITRDKERPQHRPTATQQKTKKKNVCKERKSITHRLIHLMVHIPNTYRITFVNYRCMVLRRYSHFSRWIEHEKRFVAQIIIICFVSVCLAGLCGCIVFVCDGSCVATQQSRDQRVSVECRTRDENIQRKTHQQHHNK